MAQLPRFCVDVRVSITVNRWLSMVLRLLGDVLQSKKAGDAELGRGCLGRRKRIVQRRRNRNIKTAIIANVRTKRRIGPPLLLSGMIGELSAGFTVPVLFALSD